jgi:D-serine dehydratase
VGGVTVEGIISGQEIKTGSKGQITLSMNVMGIGINAQVEIYMFADSNQATATVYPNFNSNTVWLSGTIVPYENSTVFQGNSL